MNDGTLMFSLLFKFLEGRDLLQFHQSPYDGSEIAFLFVGETGSPFQVVAPLCKQCLWRILFGVHTEKCSVQGNVPLEASFGMFQL